MSFVILDDGRGAIAKAADAVLRYGIDTQRVLDPGDTVASVEIAEAVGVQASVPQVAGSVVSALVAGGQAGAEGTVRLRWTTDLGRVDSRTMVFRVATR
jgi:hypothetical protein